MRKFIYTVFLVSVWILCGAWTHTLTFESGVVEGGGDSFDSGTTHPNSDATTQAVTDIVHSGSYAARIDFANCSYPLYTHADGPDLRVNIEDVATGGSVWVRAYIRLSSDFDFSAVDACDTSGYAIGLRFMDNEGSGSWAGWINEITQVIAQNPTARYDTTPYDNFETGKPTWRAYEYSIQNFGTSNEIHRTWVDGVLSVNNDTHETSASSIVSFRFMDTVYYGFSNAQEMWIDDIVITNETPSNLCDGYPCIGLIEEVVECDEDSDCSDGNVCTDDTCVDNTCTFTNNTDPCDDGFFCTTGDVCSGGVCSGPSETDCSDGSPCTNDICDEDSDECTHSIPLCSLTISAYDSTLTEDGGTGSVTVDCDEIQADACDNMQFSYNITGTALPGGMDFTQDKTSPVTITDKDTPTTITFTPVNDSLYEGGSGTYETFNFAIIDQDDYSVEVPYFQTFTLEDNDTQAELAAAQPRTKGIYVKGEVNDITNISDADNANIDGYAATFTWYHLDTGTSVPVYDWTDLDAVVLAMESYGKKFTLNVYPSYPALHVMYHPLLTTYYARIGGVDMTVPVPWESYALSAYDDFIEAMAAHEIGGVALADRPELSGIRAGFVGLRALDDEDGRMVALDSYSQSTFLAAIVQEITSVVDSFPDIPVFVEIEAFNGPLGGRLDETTITEISSQFTSPRIGFLNAFLTGTSPSTSTNAGGNLLFALGKGSPIYLGACGSWLNVSPAYCSFSSDDTTPENGFMYGRSTFNATYYEIDRDDINNADWQAMFGKWVPVLSETRIPGHASSVSGSSGRADFSSVGTGRIDSFHPTLE